MRFMLRSALVMLGLLSPTLMFAQGPGGGGRGPGGFGGPGGGGAFDPAAMFDRFSGGKDVINVAELDPRQSMFFKMIGSRYGLTGDVITRADFKAAAEKMTASFGGGGMGGPPGGGMGGPPGGGRGGVTADGAAETSFRQMDKNSDGLLAFEEIRSDTLKGERDKWDTNKDGFIDLNEYKAYVAARFASREEAKKESDKQAEKPVQPTVVTAPEAAPATDVRPSVIRAGKLPKELPDWFITLDAAGDSDGQVSLYEWRSGGRRLDEFLTMDLNGDNLLTAEEYLRWKKQTEALAKKNGTPTPDAVAKLQSLNEEFGNTPQPTAVPTDRPTLDAQALADANATAASKDLIKSSKGGNSDSANADRSRGGPPSSGGGPPSGSSGRGGFGRTPGSGGPGSSGGMTPPQGGGGFGRTPGGSGGGAGSGFGRTPKDEKKPKG